MPLKASECSRPCDPALFTFASTAELDGEGEIIGQDRAVSAIDFGVGIESTGYNIYVLGETGSGRTTTVLRAVREIARQRPTPSDWLYVHNFDAPHNPTALSVPSGTACTLKKDMEELIEELQVRLPLAFEDESYQKVRSTIVQEVTEERGKILEDLQKRVEGKNFTLRQVGAGFILIPMIDGKPLRPENFDQLSDEDRERLTLASKELQGEIDATLQHLRELEKQIRDRLRELDRNIAGQAVSRFLDELRSKYKDLAQVSGFLDRVQKDLVENFRAFLKEEEEAPSPFSGKNSSQGFERYSVNVIVNNSETEGAPVILETSPNYANLQGSIEHRSQMGTLMTNFTLIKPGSLHKANGGYLVLEILDLLRNPFAWEVIKRCLKSSEIDIQDITDQLGLIRTVTLDPEPIPLDLKLILIGSPWLYYLLYQLEPDFQKLFKVKADFEDRMPRTPENVQKMASFVARVCHAEKLLPFSAAAVAVIVTESSRAIEEQEKLSTKFSMVADIVREAHYWAKKSGRELVEREDVEKTIAERTYRACKIEDRLQELYDDGTFMIDTGGAVVGQVNGMAVLSMGDYSFGKPSRITCQTYAGNGGVLNIEREARLGGKIHDKGVLILQGYLKGKYSAIENTSLSASLAFEQVYEEVDGDSASSTELYALLSSISGVPLKQSFAVTGSVNQLGQVQPVGGVTRKIEGFFDVCKAKGLTGEQGVLLPHQNVRNLMLKQEVLEAIEARKFHIYPVKTIEEGMELLTGKSMGQPRKNGTYPKGTINEAILSRLKKIKVKKREESKKPEHHRKKKVKKEEEPPKQG